MTGWRQRTPMRAGELWHVYPLDDLREHVTDGRDCWCHPTPDEEFPNLLVHHAMDQRELTEEGRPPS